MKTPVITLCIATAMMFVVSIATGSAAKTDAEMAFFDASLATKAANLAAASNVALTLAGTGVIGLLVVWAVMAGLWQHTAEAAAAAPEAARTQNAEVTAQLEHDDAATVPVESEQSSAQVSPDVEISRES